MRLGRERPKEGSGDKWKGMMRNTCLRYRQVDLWFEIQDLLNQNIGGCQRLAVLLAQLFIGRNIPDLVTGIRRDELVINSREHMHLAISNEYDPSHRRFSARL